MHRLLLAVYALSDVACGLISLLTLTFYRPGWDLQVRVWGIKIELAHRRRNSDA